MSRWFEKELSVAEVERMINARLQPLISTIGAIQDTLNSMATTQADFDEKLATLKPAIDQVNTDVQALLAKAAASGVDLTAESTTLQSSLDELNTIHSSAGTPAPAPAPSGNAAATSN